LGFAHRNVSRVSRIAAADDDLATCLGVVAGVLLAQTTRADDHDDRAIPCHARPSSKLIEQ